MNIREQIKAGVFPARLKPEDWASGANTWLLDVIASDRATTGKVIANFGRVVKAHPGKWEPVSGQDARPKGAGDIRIHELVAGLVGSGTLEQLGARKGATAK